MNFLRGIKPHYMWLYSYYIDDIQGFLIYSTYHTERTEEEWKSLDWTEEYEAWSHEWAMAGDYARGCD